MKLFYDTKFSRFFLVELMSKNPLRDFNLEIFYVNFNLCMKSLIIVIWLMISSINCLSVHLEHTIWVVYTKRTAKLVCCLDDIPPYQGHN